MAQNSIAVTSNALGIPVSQACCIYCHNVKDKTEFISTKKTKRSPLQESDPNALNTNNSNPVYVKSCSDCRQKRAPGDKKANTLKRRKIDEKRDNKDTRKTWTEFVHMFKTGSGPS